MRVAHVKYPQFLQELAKQDERRLMLEKLLAKEDGTQRDPQTDPLLVRLAYDRVEKVPDPAPILYARRRRRVEIRKPDCRTGG